eukprot:gene581-628_t
MAAMIYRGTTLLSGLQRQQPPSGPATTPLPPPSSPTRSAMPITVRGTPALQYYIPPAPNHNQCLSQLHHPDQPNPSVDSTHGDGDENNNNTESPNLVTNDQSCSTASTASSSTVTPVGITSLCLHFRSVAPYRGHVVYAGDTLGRLHIRRLGAYSGPPGVAREPEESIIPVAEESDPAVAQPITALARHGQVLAIAVGAEVRLFNIGQNTLMSVRCPGQGHGTIQAIRFDVRGSLTLFATTSDRELLSFSVRGSSPSPDISKGESSCFITNKIPLQRNLQNLEATKKEEDESRSRITSSTTSLVTVKSHVLALSGCSLHIFNISSGRDRALSQLVTLPLEDCDENSPTTFAHIDTPAIDFRLQHQIKVFSPILITVGGTRGEQSRVTLKLYDPSPLTTWLRLPLLFIGVAIVVLWKVFSRPASNSLKKVRAKRGAGGGGYGSGGRGLVGEEALQEDTKAAMEELTQKLRGLRSPGRPGGAPPPSSSPYMSPSKANMRGTGPSRHAQFYDPDES